VAARDALDQPATRRLGQPRPRPRPPRRAGRGRAARRTRSSRRSVAARPSRRHDVATSRSSDDVGVLKRTTTRLDARTHSARLREARGLAAVDLGSGRGHDHARVLSSRRGA
jgi:hypothetical protein